MEKLEGDQIADCIDLKSAVVVTGEHGDQIFGSILYHGAFIPKKHFVFQKESQNGSELDKPWKMCVESRLREMQILRPNTRDKLLSLLSQQAATAPFEIVTLYDWLWWANFTFKWQYVTVRIVNRLESCSESEFANLQHFYRTEAFQRWSMDATNHQEAKFPKLEDSKGIQWSWCNYKLTLKAYIHSMATELSDAARETYFKSKEKEGSLQHQPSRHFAIDDKFNILNFGGFSCDRSRLQGKEGARTLKLLRRYSSRG